MEEDIRIHSLSSSGFSQIIRKYRLFEHKKNLNEVFELCSSLFSKDKKDSIFSAAEKCAKKHREKGVRWIHYYSEEYPELLRFTDDPPPVLYCRGNIELLKKSITAAVGTRKPSPFAVSSCSKIAEYIGTQSDACISSGLAEGIDRHIMNLSLEYNISVIGVMGTGFDKEYPSSNSDLYRKMKMSGNALILTEIQWGENPGKWSFPKRNRIISGISERVIIIECPEKSGAVSTAAHAAAQNRDLIVFDAPELLNNAGGRKLISEGAKKISPEDIGSGRVFHISELYKLPKERSSESLSRLARLEFSGGVKDLGGGYFEITDTDEVFHK
ncbi:MAG TPA: DNA-processing protein DprA [Leptospiraceae bacterium]|nr:DNA-processing protein DprA [Leptospiraceae bacterium]